MSELLLERGDGLARFVLELGGLIGEGGRELLREVAALLGELFCQRLGFFLQHAQFGLEVCVCFFGLSEVFLQLLRFLLFVRCA